MIRDSIFISYSHQDKKWLTEVKKVLSILEYNYQLVIWEDSKIKVGSNWHNEIVQSINKSKVAILLVSNNFLSSKFIVTNELPRILKAARKDGLVIFNVILDICTFQLTELKTFQCFNNPDYPLEDLERKERKAALVRLATKLFEAVKQPSNTKSVLDRSLLSDEDSPLCLPLILAYLVKTGPKPITEAQNNTGVRRKVLVAALEELQKLGYVEKIQGVYNKKPSAMWRASVLGTNIFIQFETTYNKILTLAK